MAELSSVRRARLPRSEFAIPSKAPGPGSYPLPDEDHARDALARVSEHGTDEEQAEVRAAVKRRFPDMEVDE